MPQISLYIDEKTLKKVESAASRQHISISKWVSVQIKAKIAPVYPIHFENLFGSIEDETFQAPKELNSNLDLKRMDI